MSAVMSEDTKPGRYGNMTKAYPFTGKMPPTPQPIPITSPPTLCLPPGYKFYGANPNTAYSGGFAICIARSLDEAKEILKGDSALRDSDNYGKHGFYEVSLEDLKEGIGGWWVG